MAARVLLVDYFGNLITSARIGVDLRIEEIVRCHIGEISIEKRARTFGEVQKGEAFMYEGSGGHLELAIREGSLEQRLGRVKPGMEVVFELVS